MKALVAIAFVLFSNTSFSSAPIQVASDNNGDCLRAKTSIQRSLNGSGRLDVSQCKVLARLECESHKEEVANNLSVAALDKLTQQCKFLLDGMSVGELKGKIKTAELKEESRAQ